MIATRPLEYVCFFPIELETKADGNVYMYVAVDAYSDFAFMMGTERDTKKETVLGAVRKLINDKDFAKQKHNGFTLVFHKFEELRNDIEKIITPDHGRMIVKDDEDFLSVMQPFLESFYSNMAENLKRNQRGRSAE